MRIAFIVADVRAQQPGWGTPHLALAAARRGHDVLFVGVDELTLAADNAVVARAHPFPVGADDPAALCARLAAAPEPAEQQPLAGLDVAFLRFHPQKESTGGSSTGAPALDFGWRLGITGVLVVNDPEGIRRAGGRMYLASLPAEIRPRMIVTRDPARAKTFLRALRAPAVVKPLVEQAAAEPDSLFYLERGQVKNLNQILALVRKGGYFVVQEYMPRASDGEKRLLLLWGDPVRAADGRVAIYRRQVPGIDAPGPSARAAAEVERTACDFGAAEQRIVDLLRPRLHAEGLYLVSVDIVGDRVLEVNVHAPGGLAANLALHGIDVADAVVRDLERRVEVRRAYRDMGQVA